MTVPVCVPPWWLRQTQPRNYSTTGELLVEFFRFYALEFFVEGHVVCPNIGQLKQSKASVWTTRSVKLKPQILSIRDPFDPNHNLGEIGASS